MGTSYTVSRYYSVRTGRYSPNRIKSDGDFDRPGSEPHKKATVPAFERRDTAGRGQNPPQPVPKFDFQGHLFIERYDVFV
jgi:hypothetical protein